MTAGAPYFLSPALPITAHLKTLDTGGPYGAVRDTMQIRLFSAG